MDLVSPTGTARCRQAPGRTAREPDRLPHRRSRQLQAERRRAARPRGRAAGRARGRRIGPDLAQAGRLAPGREPRRDRGDRGRVPHRISRLRLLHVVECPRRSGAGRAGDSRRRPRDGCVHLPRSYGVGRARPAPSARCHGLASDRRRRRRRRAQARRGDRGCCGEGADARSGTGDRDTGGRDRFRARRSRRLPGARDDPGLG